MARRTSVQGHFPTTALFVFLALVPSAQATHQGPSDLNAHDLNVLVYHPLPDAQGDPWGVAAMTVNGTRVDWMAGHYGAYYFPTALFDGVDEIESTPNQDQGGGYQETYTAYHGALTARLTSDSALTINLEATLESGGLRVRDLVTAPGLAPPAGLLHRFVLFEDDVRYAGGNGVSNHRFVVRTLGPLEPLGLENGTAEFEHVLGVPSLVKTDHLGVVALVLNGDDSSSVFKPKQVVQSATWTSAQDGPTNQVVHGVLLEQYSATWCVACVYGDSATDALADQYGIQSSAAHRVGLEYLRSTSPFAVAAALVAGTVVCWLVLPRRREAAP